MAKKEFLAVVIFTAVLAVGGAVTVKFGHREYSDNENRYLTQFPQIRA